MTTLQYLARRLLASLSALLSTLPAVAMESVLVLLLALAFVAQKASAAPAVVHNAPVPKGMVLQNTFDSAVATPTVKRGFVMPKFWGLVRLRHPHLVSGGMGVSAKTAARLNPCFEHPAHLLRFKTQTVALESHSGAKTMTKPQGTTTPAAHHTTEERRAFAALEAANCAALARWYSARGNVKAARRKAVQLLAALAVLEGVQHA